MDDDDDDESDDDDEDDKDEDGGHAEHKAHESLDELEETIAANQEKVKKLEAEIAELEDEDSFHAEVEKAVKKVANETQTVHMASFLGDMWKEERMFSAPFYIEHLEEEDEKLEHVNKKLEKKAAKLEDAKEPQDG